MRKGNFLFLIVIGVFLIALNACTKDNIDEVQPPEISICSDSIIYSYANDVVPTLNANGSCYNCHSAAAAPFAGDGIILEGYDNFNANKEAVLGSIKHGAGYSPMPKGGNKISNNAITVIECWIEQGALDN